MTKEYLVVDVIHKPTGEKRTIKLDRYNEEIHKKIGDPKVSAYVLEPGVPVNLQSDPVAKAVTTGSQKREKKLAEKKEKEDNKFDPSVDLTDEELTGLPFFSLKAYAKHRGIELEATDKKENVMAKIRESKNI